MSSWNNDNVCISVRHKLVKTVKSCLSSSFWQVKAQILYLLSQHHLSPLIALSWLSQLAISWLYLRVLLKTLSILCQPKILRLVVTQRLFKGRRVIFN